MAGTTNLTGSTTHAQQLNATLDLLTFRRVWVESPMQHGSLLVYWKPRPFKTNRYPTGFNVYRSQDPGMTFTAPRVTKVTASPVAIPMYRDTTVDTRVNTRWYYVVTEVFSDGTEEAIEEPVTMEISIGGENRRFLSPVKIYHEFKRRKYIILGRTAEWVDFLIRRRAGTRCDCFDGEYEHVGQADCTKCYATGWDRGYELLRQVKCRILSISEVLQLQPRGLVFNSGPRGWLVEYPLLRNGDVVVRRTGERYEIDSLDPVIHQGVLTEQNFNLKVLPETHPVHNFVIPDSDATA